ncbi:AAA domain-containing protein [Nocardiopsis alba]|uniref:AAA domain-containing protein n=1 Tax=Nocardiopsis alba TaxID=53437 RepID=UPI0036529C39
MELLRELWTGLPKDASVGVVSPFTTQVRAIEGLPGPEVLKRIRVGAAHTFQRGERGVVVVSPAAATGVHRSSGQWALRQQNLWNVAVTRSRSRLYVVGDWRYWAEQGAALRLRRHRRREYGEVGGRRAEPPVRSARSAGTGSEGRLSGRGLLL